MNNRRYLYPFITGILDPLGSGDGPSFIIYDSFTDVDGTSLADHTPDIDTVGSGWEGYYYYGDGMEIVGNKAVNETGDQSKIHIDTGLNSNLSVEAAVTAPSDAYYNNWRVIIGLDKELPDNSEVGYFAIISYSGTWAIRIVKDGTTHYRLNEALTWPEGSTHIIKLSVNNGMVRLYFDGDEVGQFFDAEGTPDGTLAYLDFRVDYAEGSSLDEFYVSAITPVPPLTDYLVYDTFTEASATGLDAHTPDKDTVGLGWNELSGTWIVSDDSNPNQLSVENGGVATLDIGTSNQDFSIAYLPAEVGEGAEIFARFVDMDTHIVLLIDQTTGTLTLQSLVNTVVEELDTYVIPGGISPGGFYSFRMIVGSDNIVFVQLNGVEVMAEEPSGLSLSNKIAIGTSNLMKIVFDDLRVTAL